MSSPLTVGGLFSGIGGWELGLERAGMEIAWHCESDPFCRKVLAKHWPDVPYYEDICGLTGADVSPVDVLAGGFPCQDISLAGKGAGIDGARSGLWSEFARLIGELRPRYVCVENVSALLGRGLDRVLGDLSALGFDAEWDCIPASAVGAPHRRERVWILGYPNGQGQPISPIDGEAPELPQVVANRLGIDGPRAECCRDCGRRSEPSARDCGCGRGIQATNERWPIDDAHGRRHGASQGQIRPRRDGTLDAGWWLIEPDVGRVANGVPARVDRLRSLGNALVPQIAEWIGRRVIEWERANDAGSRSLGGK